MPSRKQHRRVEAHWPVLLERTCDARALECAENEGWRVQATVARAPAIRQRRADRR